MIYTYPVDIPANTSDADPVKVVMALTHGVIHRVELSFPPGCNFLVKVGINRALHQVWPTNPEGRFQASGYTISFDVYQEMFSEPLDLEIRGSSPGTSYDHTVRVRIGLRPIGQVTQATSLVDLMGRIGKAVLGRGK